MARRRSDPAYDEKMRKYAREFARAWRQKDKGKESMWKTRGLPIPSRPRPEACELCGKAGKVVNDHCHETGKFRGWLCMRCNVCIGALGDTVEKLSMVVEYLRKA